MLDLIKVLILGIVEGVTEFLPISSTGHLIVATALLQPFNSLFSNPDQLQAFRSSFEIFIQLGAIIAVVAYYRVDIWRQISTVRTDRQVQHFWIAILIAFVPAIVLGVVLRDFIKTSLYSPLIVAVSLIVGGILFILIEQRLKDETRTTDSIMEVSYRQALVIGLIQTIALIPGVSRAASSIFGGMLSGLNRETATRFSFYLAIPTLTVATLGDLALTVKDQGLQTSGLLYLAVGLIVSAIVAWFAIGWLLRYISGHTFIPFGYYRIAAGIVIILLFALAVL